jgi:hypothetical protein
VELLGDHLHAARELVPAPAVSMLQRPVQVVHDRDDSGQQFVVRELDALGLLACGPTPEVLHLGHRAQVLIMLVSGQLRQPLYLRPQFVHRDVIAVGLGGLARVFVGLGLDIHVFMILTVLHVLVVRPCHLPFCGALLNI